ncbi:MAG: ATP-binding cassette domain-containing protein [Bacteroidetes bacterium]|nr:ATP-binding cassette domain-containing protein [Bacteroidota bacterium]MBT3751544.1 ATP-binding cassette domain-containing protein [Bacteroidota bacterium]MBT4402215.1 ATP-binding cassette domain-containing protein [Bacteroidota bacterium]MBT4411327.1 ATP-binding cassette domain-containing protein [Bacteroidota bacterium]MBT7465303.1 ATP-binding cassette domain-containing protein [Bacteroidota bacterium]
MKYDKIKRRKITRKGLFNVWKLFGYIKPYRLEYGLGLFFLLGASLANLAFPKLLGDLVNSGNTGQLNNDLSNLIILLVIILIVQALFSYFRTVLFVNVTEKSMADLRRKTYSHLVKLPMRFFDKNRVGELNSRISADVSLVQETLTSTLADFIRQVVIISGGIILLLSIVPQLTLFMLAILPVVVILVFFFGRFIRRFSKDAQKKVAESNTIVEETLQGITSVKGYTNEFFEIARYHKKILEVAQIGMKSGRYRGAFSVFLILSVFGSLVAVVWKGAILMSQGEMLAGDLFSFVIYSAYIGGNIGGMAAVITRMQRFIGATEDLFEIFNAEEETITQVSTDSESANRLTGEISFENLSFAYPSRKDEMVLQSINLTIRPNQMIALVGPSGAGKSSIANLILRLYEPTDGKIMYDKHPAGDYELSDIRNHIALVPQDIFLFGGSIRENIAYGKPGASEDAIRKAAEKANAWEFISRFPDELETIVGERGTQLSGGQRQRIAIARAILNDPRILILDEATSSLDAESEKLVQEALEKLMIGRTSIVIAHRLSTIHRADQIFVLDQGSIVELGTHKELMEKTEGVYRKLNELQLIQ